MSVQQSSPERLDAEVVIYGATSAGVAAAIQTARLGRRVILVSPDEHIGEFSLTLVAQNGGDSNVRLCGIQIEGLGATDIDNQPEVHNSTTLGGLALEFHRRLSKHYGRLERLEKCVAERIKDPEVWRFESSVAERVIQEWLAESPQIQIVKGTLDETAPVTREGGSSSGRISGLRMADGRIVSGKVFIEASYEGDLLAGAGVTTTYGREASATYGERQAGVREHTTYRQIDVPVDPYRTPGDPSSGLIHGVSPEPFGQAGAGDRHLAAFSYRVPLTDRPDNRLPLYQPEGYDASHYELHRRFAAAGGAFFAPVTKLPGGKTDLIGSEAPLATDLLGMNDGWAAGGPAARRRILDDTARFTQGLLWFLANDESVPALLRAQWARFGYCLDEFADNNHFPRRLYVRDARRMVSDYVITEHTMSALTQGQEDEVVVEDPVAVAYWPPDTHSVRRIVRDGRVHNEGFVFREAGHTWRPFGIAYRALVPRRGEADNVLTATCPSSSHVGYGAVRLEHQFHALGQACANACDLALGAGVAVQDVDYKMLRERLLGQGMVLDASLVGAPVFPSSQGGKGGITKTVEVLVREETC